MTHASRRVISEPANFVGLSRAVAALDATAREGAASDHARHVAIIALEELYANLLRSSGPNVAASQVRLVITCDAQGVVIDYEDEGGPYDPTDPTRTPDAQGDAGDGLRGAGAALIRELPAEISYRRENDRNRIRLVCRG